MPICWPSYKCKQQHNEPVSQYAFQIETCLSELLTEISISRGHKSRDMFERTAAMDKLALHHFQMGLIPRISNIIRCKSPKSLNEVINIAISEEKIQQHLFKQSSTTPKPNSPRSNLQSSRRDQPPVRPNRPRTTLQNRPTNINNSYQNHVTPICRYCKHPGQTIEQCRKRQYNNNRSSSDKNKFRHTDY